MPMKCREPEADWKSDGTLLRRRSGTISEENQLMPKRFP